MSEHDGDVDPLIIFRCIEHGERWLKWNRICHKCMARGLDSFGTFHVLDMRDSGQQAAFLDALKRQGIPIAARHRHG